MAQERNLPPPSADTSGLDFHHFGLLAVQDGGRRKPIDTFSRETLIRITGRSTYVGKAGRKWQANDFVLSGALETHDWRTEPMVLVSLGQLKEKLGLDKTERRFSFEQLVASTELQRLTNEAHALKRAEKTLDRVQQEALAVSDRLALLANVMNGSALLIVPASKSETDPWVVPPEFSRYYSETQFAPVQIELQTMATSYVQADRFNFSRAASRLVMRCLIAGRPPVTNMYESIIWVSFAVSFFGMIFFARYRTSVYLLAALPVSLIALLLVHQMPIAMPSNIDPLVPVLRDNFWLTVHVLTITLSYAACALAMGFGHILLWRYARNPAVARADAPMHFWLYRVLQLGVLLLAAGTILGGVWANYSWGRFWGWDPKETWALIALLCYLTTLHGRLAGWWTEFGLVVASVVCFLAVLMAWYGVNFVLGKGLHSYGFGIGGETYVAIGVALDLLFVAFAIWRYRSSTSVATERAPEPIGA